MFEKAARLKLRFDSPVGQLSVEELWDLPLVSIRKNQVDLDSIAVGLDAEIKSTNTTSFVKKTTRTASAALLKLKFDIVLRVIEVKQIEADAEETKRTNAEKKQKLLTLIEQKQDESLKGKSVDELQALVNAL